MQSKLIIHLRATFSVLCLTVLLAASVAALRPRDANVIEALDLSRPELASVRQAVEARDLDSAKAELVAYFRSRQTPLWSGLDWARQYPERVKRMTRTAMSRTFSRAGATYTFSRDQPIDWDFNPTEADTTTVVQNEWTWQLNRHHDWYALALAYGQSGDEKFAAEFTEQFKSWVDQCPRPTDSTGNYPKSAWRTIETGIRASGTWPSAFYGFKASPSFDDDAVMDMLHLFAEHARHLMPADHFRSGSNWGTMESNGLFTIGVLFPEFRDAAMWRKTGIDRLYGELEKQVYPDGMQIELSTGYHQVSLRNFYDPLKLARLNDIAVPDGYLSRLERMFHFNVYLAAPDGRLPALGDAGRTDVRARMRVGVELFPNRKDFLWAATLGKQGQPPEETSSAFPYSGYLAMRSGWDTNDLYASFDVGPYGYGHQHEDKLSLVVYAYGKELITDPGNYHYDRSPYRRHILSAAGHNTVLIDGEGQHRRGARDRWSYVTKEPLLHQWVTHATYDFAEGVFDEGFGSHGNALAAHSRRVLFVKPNPESNARTGYWVIHDRIIPQDDGNHNYEALFHLNAELIDVAVSNESASASTQSDEANILIQADETGDSAVRVIAGQDKPMRGWKRARKGAAPLPVVSFTSEGSGRQDRLYLLIPTPAGEVALESSFTLSATDGGISGKVRFEGGETHWIGFADHRQAPPRSFGKTRPDIRAFWLAKRGEKRLGGFVVE
jgi:hypothetical protein